MVDGEVVRLDVGGGLAARWRAIGGGGRWEMACEGVGGVGTPTLADLCGVVTYGQVG